MVLLFEGHNDRQKGVFKLCLRCLSQKGWPKTCMGLCSEKMAASAIIMLELSKTSCRFCFSGRRAFK